MIKSLIFFETTEELEKLTGLNHQELWDAGFVLDDMDWGFCCNKKYVEEIKDEYGCTEYRILRNDDVPRPIEYLLDWMDNYCVGFHYTEYDNYHYYTLHHA